MMIYMPVICQAQQQPASLPTHKPTQRLDDLYACHLSSSAAASIFAHP
jgi:hypothetical protein